MVAYSFQKLFAPMVEDGRKPHTIRGRRKRHARVGEPVQLYYAMRTKHCRKLVDPDPICVRVDEIRMEVAGVVLPGEILGGRIDAIAINGIPLSDDEIERLAIADGFDNVQFDPGKGREPVTGDARTMMGHWWGQTHPSGTVFEGNIIHWAPRWLVGVFELVREARVDG